MTAKTNSGAARYRIGIDVGGTFTDLFLLDETSGAVARHKLLSTPGEPHRAPLAGIREILATLDGRGADVGFVGLGTTVMGILRDMRLLADHAGVSLRSSRQKFPAPGMLAILGPHNSAH